MVELLNSKLSYLFLAGSILCAGQSEYAAAMQWADYYATAYRVSPMINNLIDPLSGHVKFPSKPSIPFHVFSAFPTTWGSALRLTDNPNGGIRWLLIRF